MTSELIQSGLSLMISIGVDAAIKAMLLLSIACLICFIYRSASAAVRHQIWSLAFCGIVLLPLGSLVIPQWRIPVLPSRIISGVLPANDATRPKSDKRSVEDTNPVINVDPMMLNLPSVEIAEARAGQSSNNPVQRSPGGKIHLSKMTNDESLETSSSNEANPSSSGLAGWTSLDRFMLPIALLWLTGFVLVIAPLASGAVLVRRLVSRSRRMTDLQAAELLQDYARRLGLARRVTIVETDDCVVPMTFGVLQPFVVLPLDWRSWSEGRLRFVLLHELAHIHRLDVFFQVVGYVTCGMHWFNPLAWFALCRLRIEREFACDDCVVTAGEAASDYANELIEIASLYRSPRLSVGIAITRSSALEERIVAMFNEDRSHLPVGRSVNFVLVTLAVLIVIAVSLITLGEQASAAVEPPLTATKQENAAQPTADANKGDQPVVESAIKIEEATTDKSEQPKRQSRDKREKQTLIQVRVIGADKKPVKGAEIYWFRTRVHDLRPMKPKLVATTNSSGKARFESPWAAGVNKNEPAGWEYMDKIVIKAKGHSFLLTSPNELRHQTTVIGSFFQAIGGNAEWFIALRAAGEPIRGQIINIDGQPVAGATLRIRWFDDQPINDVKDRKFHERVWHLKDVIEPEPLRHVLPLVTTDAEGRFELTEIGENCLVELLVQGDQIESMALVAFNGADGNLVVPQGPRHDMKSFTLYGRKLRIVVGPSKPVEGRVVDFDSGDPIPDAIVRAFAIHGINLYSSREREEFATRTDGEGRFRITGLPIGDENRLAAFTTGDVAYIPIGHQVKTSDADPVLHCDFRLKRGVWAEGRVFDTDNDKPFTGEITYYWFRNHELEATIPGLRDVFLDGCYWTNANGEFRVPVLPTRGILAYRYDGDYRTPDPMSRYPRGYGADSIAGSEKMGSMASFPTLPLYLIPSNYNRLAEVKPDENAKTIRVDMTLQANRPVSVKVTDAEGKPVVGFDVYGAAENWGWQSKDQPDFEVGDLRPGEQRKIFVFHRARNLAGGATVNLKTQEAVQIELTAAGSISGQLIDQDGEPVKDASLFTDYEKLQSQKDAAIWANGPKLIYNPTTIPVDKEGRFLVDGLIPGWKYSAHASVKQKIRGELMDQVIGDPFKDVTIEPGEKKNLGVIKLTPRE